MQTVDLEVVSCRRDDVVVTYMKSKLRDVRPLPYLVIQVVKHPGAHEQLHHLPQTHVGHGFGPPR